MEVGLAALVVDRGQQLIEAAAEARRKARGALGSRLPVRFARLSRGAREARLAVQHDGGVALLRERDA